METEFWRTRMGQKYYDSDIPKIVNSLKSIARSLEEIASLLKQKKETDNE